MTAHGFSDQLVQLGQSCRVESGVALSRFTSLRIGGSADFFARVRSVDPLKTLLHLAERNSVPVAVLGSGSGVIVSDSGFRGLVIKMETDRIRIAGIRGTFHQKTPGNRPATTVFIEADAGVGMNRLVRYTLDQGLSGIETFIGQPGTVGGALAMDCRAFPSERRFREVIYSCTVMDRLGSVRVITRDSVRFNTEMKRITSSGDIILSLTLPLVRRDRESVWKTAQETAFQRSRVQPSNIPSIGYVFRDITQSQALVRSTPGYTRSASYLIEQAGLGGFRVGSVSVWKPQPNFFVVQEGAKAGDVVKLMTHIRNRVRDRYHIHLQPERTMVGEF